MQAEPLAGGAGPIQPQPNLPTHEVVAPAQAVAGFRDDASHIAELKPWTWPWWRPARGDTATFLWLMTIHLAAVAGLVLAPVPGWPVFAAALSLHFLGGLGTTVAFHRAIAHKSLKLHPAAQGLLTFFAMLNGSGTPLSWAANHRLHHAKSDTPEDVSSPRIGGFWWSHLRWLWQAGPAPVARYCPDMGAAGYARWSRLQVPMSALGFFIGAPFGLAAFVWMGPVRLVLALHAQCFVNSVCHMGKVSKPAEDSSVNVRWLSLMHCFQGENWHRNHHARPGSARLGWTLAQPDLGWWCIRLLQRLGLATDVRIATRQG